MSFDRIMDIAASSLGAEELRMNTCAQNMGAAKVVTGSPDEVYKPKYPVFKEIQAQASQMFGKQQHGGVSVAGIQESDKEPLKRYEPNNPLADADGFVYSPHINSVEEMANWVSASLSYQFSIEMMNSAKQLTQQTLHLGEY